MRASEDSASWKRKAPHKGFSRRSLYERRGPRYLWKLRPHPSVYPCARIQERRPGLFHLSRRFERVKELREEAAEAGRKIARPPVPLLERKPPGYDRSNRGPRTRNRVHSRAAGSGLGIGEQSLVHGHVPRTLCGDRCAPRRGAGIALVGYSRWPRHHCPLADPDQQSGIDLAPIGSQKSFWPPRRRCHSLHSN